MREHEEMKDFDWLMLLPMGFMGGWIGLMITVIIKGVKDE